MYYVYMIRCADSSLYTGLTNDLCHRMRVHAAGKGAKYTRSHPVAALAALWRCRDATAARRLEYAVKKGLERRDKETLIAAPDLIEQLMPQLVAEDYVPVTGVTLADCLEGRFDG